VLLSAAASLHSTKHYTAGITVCATSVPLPLRIAAAAAAVTCVRLLLCRLSSALCKAGTGGARCQPCPAGTYSSGAPVGKECGQCPPHAMCMRMPMPCEEMPTCDPKTGKVASMCWVKKPEGAACNPESGMIMPADTSDGMSYTCQAGECVPSP
jgi:hypothetical protein